MRHDSRTAFACHEYLHKVFAPTCFDLSKMITIDPLPDALKKAGIAFEQSTIEFLTTLNLKMEILDSSFPDNLWERATARAMMNPDIDIIYRASIGEFCEQELAKLRGVDDLGDPLRVSRPDLLIKVGTSSAGYPLWAPVDIKSHNPLVKSTSNNIHVTKWPDFHPEKAEVIKSRLREDDALQLAHYLRHLQALGFASDAAWAGVLGKDQSFIAWADLGGLTLGRESALTVYELGFAEAIKIKDLALARRDNPALPPVTIPRRISECGTCEMRKVCRIEMESFDNGAGHVTLLSEVTASKAATNLDGIESIAELVKATGLSAVGMKAVTRAKVWQSKVPVLLDQSKEFKVPAFDVEIDIDLENSQAGAREAELEESLGRDVLYMYGFGIHDRTVNPDWRSVSINCIDDYSDSDESEFTILTQMWTRLETEVAKAESEGKTIGIFHYSPYEKRWWRDFTRLHAVKPGTPTLDRVEKFMDKYFIDLWPIAKEVAFPATGYSIKTLAPLAGFNWEVDSAGGDNSIVMYEKAISPGSNEQEKSAAIKWLRDYNRDDVKATFAVREYLRSLQL
jgi:predicted RecB family nuclease